MENKFIKTSCERMNFGCGKKYMKDWFNVDGGKHLINVDACFRFDVFPYPLEDEQFSEVLCQHVLEHISFRKQESVLKELYRVVKKGGVLVVEVPNWKFHAEWLLNGKVESNNQHFDYTRQKFISIEERFLNVMLGGQAHDEDFHIGMLWRERLERLLKSVGWIGVQVKEEGETLKARAEK